MPTVYWSLKRTAGGWEGHIVVHLNPGVVEGGGNHKTSARGKTRAEAIGKAAISAERIVNAVEQDPIARLLLPPGAVPAIEGIKAIAKAHPVGRAMEAVEALGGNPTYRKLASIL